jgi:mannitol-1-phosphate/altronate dehydrogenase
MNDDKGYFMNDVDIVSYINRNNIPTTSESTTKKTESICESFAKWLDSYSENDKQRRRKEYNNEQDRQTQRQIEYKKQQKEEEVKPLIQSSNRWIPSFMRNTDKKKEEDLEYNKPD